MGRWSRLTWCAGILVATGCATPTLTPGNLTERSSTESMSHTMAPMVTSSKSKDPDLPADQSAKLCMATAEELEKNGHYDQAVNQYELALKHEPRTPGIGRKLAACYARQGQYDKSIAQYQKELAVSPKDADLLNDLGYTFYEKEDYENAEKYLRQAIAARQNYQRAHGNLGLVLGKQMKWKECLEAFKKAGTPATAQANLAAMYMAANRPDDARRCCNIALGLDPSLKTAKELMTKLDSMTKDEGKSIQQAEARLSQESTTNATPAASEMANAIQLQKPVRTSRPQEPLEFRPVK